MSVSIVLVPVVLAARFVMGETNFNNWLDSQQLKLPCNFASDEELIEAVNNAGLRTIRYVGNIKTYLPGNNYFYWGYENGSWIAILSPSDPPEYVRGFMEQVNEGAGRSIFDIRAIMGKLPAVPNGQTSDTIQAVQAVEPVKHSAEAVTPVASVEPIAPMTPIAAVTPVPAPTFPTHFRDGDLLFRALQEFGITPVRNGDTISCKLEEAELIFHPHGDAPYEVEIRNAPDYGRIYEYLTHLDSDYKRCVQDLVYTKLKERACERNMTVTGEEVLEDNSIVVTLTLDNQRGNR